MGLESKCGLCGSTDVTVGRGIACRGGRDGCQPIEVGECNQCRAMLIDGTWHMTKKPGSVTKGPHPDFLAVDAEHRWAGPLAELFPALRTEAWGRKGGSWAWRVLPHGCLVSVRIVHDPDRKVFNVELRLARKDAPKTPEGWDKWAVEMKTFLTHFGGGDQWEEITKVEGKCDVIYTSPVAGRPPSDEEKCARCGKPAKKGPYKEALCTACATAAGTAEADARRVEREKTNA